MGRNNIYSVFSADLLSNLEKRYFKSDLILEDEKGENDNMEEKKYNQYSDCKLEGVKNDKDKLRFDLIPPLSMEKVAEVFTYGAKCYGDRNWENGLKFSRLLGAMERHLNKFKQGVNLDSESKCHHLASVVFCALAIMEFQEVKRFDLDDRSKLYYQTDKKG